MITLELREDRAAQARDFFERAGVADRVELIEGDARETIEAVDGPIDMLFVDAAKDEYTTLHRAGRAEAVRAGACWWWTTC